MVHTFRPGTDVWIASDAPSGDASAVFEDDTETGYFYAVDRCAGDVRILDALHVYDVVNVIDRDRDSTGEIRWTADGRHAALLINGHAHAVFDFHARSGCCRTGFPPPPSTGWSPEGHGWRDESMAPFAGTGAERQSQPMHDD